MERKKIISTIKNNLTPLLIQQKDLLDTKQVMFHVHNNHFRWTMNYGAEYYSISGKIAALMPILTIDEYLQFKKYYFG